MSRELASMLASASCWKRLVQVGRGRRRLGPARSASSRRCSRPTTVARPTGALNRLANVPLMKLCICEEEIFAALAEVGAKPNVVWNAASIALLAADVVARSSRHRRDAGVVAAEHVLTVGGDVGAGDQRLKGVGPGAL